MKVITIASEKIKKAEYNSKKELINGPKSSFLELEISGENITTEFINAIRRSIMNYIPTYAFTKELINITKNTSNLNNDMIKLRITQLPVLNVDAKIDYYNDMNNDKQKNVNLKINVNNNSNTILNVTTNESVLTIDDKRSDKYKIIDPILILQLIPKSEIICDATAIIGIGNNNAIWSAGQCYYEEITENKFKMTIKSNGQYTEHELLTKACKYLITNMEIINDKIKDQNFPSNQQEYIITLENEDFTCANLINYFIQDDENVNAAGITRENYSIDNIQFKIELKNKKIDIKTVFETAIKTSIAIIKKFEKNIIKI